MIFSQYPFSIRCEWGEHGIRGLAPISDVVIIVDVMSFSSCVSIAVSRGAQVIPHNKTTQSPLIESRIQHPESAPQFPTPKPQSPLEVAGSRGEAKYSLSLTTMTKLPAGAQLVLPSPNGSKLSLATGHTPTLAGCLRNAKAVADAAQQMGKEIAVIPAGERWKDDGSLRPAIEDLIGAGAIIQHLTGTLSPMASAAVAVYKNFSNNLLEALTHCSSGEELIALGYEHDIALCAEEDADDCIPILKHGVYVGA